MKHEARHKEQEQQQASGVQSQPNSPREFASAEEMLRFDAKQTEVPSGVARRLDDSIQALPPPARSWWRRLLGGSG